MRIIGYTFLGLLTIALIILIPFGFIWSVNTLFNLSIAYTLKAWCASLILLILIGNAGTSIKRKSNTISLETNEKKCCRAK